MSEEGWVDTTSTTKISDDFGTETDILLEVSKASSRSMCACKLQAAVSTCGCCKPMVRSSGYETMLTPGSREVGKSKRKKLKREVERTASEAHRY